MSLKTDLATAKQQFDTLDVEYKQALIEIEQAKQRAELVRENRRQAMLRVDDLEKQIRIARPLSKTQQALVDLVKSGADIRYHRDFMGNYSCDNVIPDKQGRPFCSTYERVNIKTLDSLIEAGHLRRVQRIGNDGKPIRNSWVIELAKK